MKNLGIVLSVGFFCVVSGCKSSDPEMKLQPANLVVSTVVSPNGTGLVTFEANAENATRYVFSFGDGSTGESTVGEASHSYPVSDLYKVQVTAFSKDNLSVEKQVEVTVSVTIASAGYSTPDNYAGLTLVWQDEFEGTALKTANWTHELGGSGWGNNELQYYQEQNTLVENGLLIIRAKRENVGGKSYTSSRIITQGKKAFKFGRVDIRAKLPKGQGIWPALWMLGSNISAVGWPKCGEIDIMEMIGGTGNDNKSYGTAHWDNAGSHAQYGGNKSLTGGKIFADDFHVFSIVWDASFITWYLDDVQFHVIDITPDSLSELRGEAFFIFNVAVGGNWPGSPDGTTSFPQFMAVDYIRVFQ
ncbi:MAG: family 16 glycosylhydrolase [Cyclobacteriaceae bacterium]